MHGEVQGGGTVDRGTVVPVDWQADYAHAVSKLGGSVMTRTYSNDDNVSLVTTWVCDARAGLTSLLYACGEPCVRE